MATLPHEREKIFLDDAIDDCLKGVDKLVVIVSTTGYSESEWFMKQAQRITEELPRDFSRRIKIFREGLEFDNGAQIVFTTMERMERLRGMRPSKIVIMGKYAEFWYLATSTGCPIQAVA